MTLSWADAASLLSLPAHHDRVRLRAVPFGEDAAADGTVAAELTDRLRGIPAAARRIALLLADGGADDTGAAAVDLLRALAAGGHTVVDMPDGPAELLARLRSARPAFAEALPLPDYYAFLHALPAALQTAVGARWGSPEADPRFRTGELHCGEFALPAVRCGHAAVALTDAQAGIPLGGDGAPRHGVLALHAWLQDVFRADVAVMLEADPGGPYPL